MKKFLVCTVLSALLMAGGMMGQGEAAPQDARLMGGWNATESPEIPEEVTEVFHKAFDGFVGVDYEPVAYLGYQIVAGKNHCLLCQARVVYPDAEPYYALVYLYEDLSGNGEIKNIVPLDLAEFSSKKEEVSLKEGEEK